MKNTFKFIAFLALTSFGILSINAQQQTTGVNSKVKTPEKVGKRPRVKEQSPKRLPELPTKVKSIIKIF